MTTEAMISHLGRYEIIEELGRGAMGIVYKAKDPLIERLVAIKSINLQVLPAKEKAEYAARFYQEAKAAGHLNHPNIVTIHDLGESGDVAYIAMELMEGRELKSVMDGVRRLSTEEALNIAIQVADGLYYAHQRGIVHRDIKPSNIMLLGDRRVKIADFGIAQMSSSLVITKAGMIMGSPLYMSPEQIMSREVDARSDIFSLGIVLYQMLAGRLPFMGDNANAVMYQIVNEDPPRPSSLNPDVSDMLDDIVLKCLAKTPSSRYLNASDLATDLRACHAKLLRAKAGINHPLMTNERFNQLRKLATPGAIPSNYVATGSFFIMGMLFVIDLLSHTQIQMHALYLPPLLMISYHCGKLRLIHSAVLVALVLQSILILSDANLSMPAKIVLAVLVFTTNVLVTYVARIARVNFLEVGRLVSFDKMTGLRNRLSFELAVDAEIETQRQNSGVLSFAYLDINKLKELNDSRGALAGDEAVKLIANVIREHVRSFDTSARIGGDEFAILMPNTKEADCKSLCEELSMKISGRLEEANIPVSVSVGHITLEQPPVSISDLLHKAEAAMLEVQAKQHVLA